MALDYKETRMTLIITELSEFGIVMVADTALTQYIKLPNGTTHRRILNGIEKLQQIPTLHAGISMWELSTIKTDDGTIPVDIWIRDFIRRMDRYQILRRICE